MVAIQENHTEQSNNKIAKTKKLKQKSKKVNKSKLKRKGKKKNKKSPKGLTNVNIRKPAELIKTAEENLNKSLEEKDPKLVLEEGTRYLNKLTFDTSEEKGVTIGKYNISTKDVSEEDLKFIEENLNKLTIIALYDAVTVQGKLWINAISELVSPDVHDEIIASNEREARKALELGKNFSILRENKELIKEMILAVLKNIFEENEGNSQKGFLGRSWDRLVGNAGTPMKAFINFIDKNPLILELNKLPEDEKEELKYYACLTALHLNDKSSFFNDIPASKFFAKMVGGLSYLPLDPKKTKNELAEQTVKINTYDKKNCKELFTWLFDMAGASKPKLQIVPKTEFCLDSTLSARMLTLVGGGLAIGSAAIIGYRGYKDPENKELGFWNKAKKGLITQGKKDFKRGKDFSLDTYNKGKDFSLDKYNKVKNWTSEKYKNVKNRFKKSEEAPLKEEAPKIEKRSITEDPDYWDKTIGTAI